MKFTEKLEAHLTTEWRIQYVSYLDLKTMLINVIANAPDPKVLSERIVEAYFESFEEDFFFECEKELNKINNFYAEKLAQATRTNEVISTNLNIIADDLKKRSPSRYSLHASQYAKVKDKKKSAYAEDLREAYSELYLSLVLLQNYKVLNRQGFQKILKKHDKLMKNSRGMTWLAENVDTASFYVDRVLEDMIEEVEFNFTTYLENGNRSRAMDRLRVPRLEETQDTDTVFTVGFMTGAIVVMMSVIFFLSYTRNKTLNTESITGIILFRGPFYIVLYLFLLGINVFAWRFYGVNHVLIFEINARTRLTYSQVLLVHGYCGVLWSLCVIGFFFARQMNISRYWFPMLFPLTLLIILSIPFDVIHLSGRIWFWKLLVHVLSAPFVAVGFRHFFIGDQLNSLIVVLVDFKNMVRFYIANPTLREDVKPIEMMKNDYLGDFLIRLLPPWIRFAQCLRRYYDTRLAFPFLWNALKFATSLPMEIFSTLLAVHKDEYSDNLFENLYVWLYLIAQLIQSLSFLSWDILRDFGLFATFSGDRIFLRNQIVYPRAFYYFAIIENIMLRFVWILTFYLVYVRKVNQPVWQTVVGCLEIFRRYIWNYLRLEHEHIYNIGQFRAVRDIFIAPMVDVKEEKKN